MIKLDQDRKIKEAKGDKLVEFRLAGPVNPLRDHHHRNESEGKTLPEVWDLMGSPHLILSFGAMFAGLREQFGLSDQDIWGFVEVLLSEFVPFFKPSDDFFKIARGTETLDFIRESQQVMCYAELRRVVTLSRLRLNDKQESTSFAQSPLTVLRIIDVNIGKELSPSRIIDCHSLVIPKVDPKADPEIDPKLDEFRTAGKPVIGRLAELIDARIA